MKIKGGGSNKIVSITGPSILNFNVIRLNNRERLVGKKDSSYGNKLSVTATDIITQKYGKVFHVIPLLLFHV